jgi:hypothetical protein
VGIRETLNDNQRATTIVAGAVAVIAIGLIVWQATGGGAPTITAQAFYTTDDGKTWFADDIYKPAPFQHEGKPAYGAIVLECPGVEPHVAYLTRLAGNFHQEATRLDPSDQAFGLQFEALQQQGLEVRKPGETTWHRVDSGAAQRLVEAAQKCPDGTTAEPVVP